MKISYLPVFLAVASFPVLGLCAGHVRVVRQLGDMTTLMSAVMSMIMPSEVMSVFTESFEQIFSAAPMDLSVLSMPPLGRKRRSALSWETQLKRIRNEVETLERMMEERTVASLPLVDQARVRRSSDGENSGDTSDIQGKAMEGAMKGAEMAGNGMKGAQKGAKMATEGAEGAKAGADALGNGAEVLATGPKMFEAGAQKGQEVASGFSG